MEYQLSFDGKGARLLKNCVDLYLNRWPGGDPAEQNYLFALQKTINAIVLEDNMQIDMPEL
jgi:hypothetical protein